MPSTICLNNFPLFVPMIINSDPVVATKFTNAENLPRHFVVLDVMGELVGQHRVFWSSGTEWKELRSIETPGFSTNFLLGRVPRMLDHMLVFEDIMAHMAESGK